MSAPNSSHESTTNASIPLIPAPRSQRWEAAGVNEWVTRNPYNEVRMSISPELEVNEYALSISHAGAAISAGSEAALADGRNAFAQLIALITPTAHDGEYRIPAVTINDSPAYAWRGLMLDVARHFLPLDQIRLLIDAMAMYRLNVLHLHLTDDQGWRVEVRGYPRLTEVGAWRERTVEGIPAFDNTDTYSSDRHGGFYTQAELKELVAYAKERGIMVLPEISLPGHVQAAIASYPKLGNFPHKQLLVRETWGESQHVLGTSEEAFQFVEDVLEQVADIFEGPFVHIGADDVPLTEWESSPDARHMRTEWGYTRASEIFERFTTHAAKVLKEKGKRVAAWDSASLVRVPDNTLIMHREHGKSLTQIASRGFQCVAASTLDLGLDHVQGPHEPTGQTPSLTLKEVYTRTLIPSTLTDAQSRLVLGIHAHASSQYIPTAEHLQYMLFPRLIAVAQRAWGAAALPFKEFEHALPAHERVLDTLGVQYRGAATTGTRR